MEIVITDTPHKAYSLVASIFAQHILHGVQAIGLATGSSPLGIYRELISLYLSNKLSFAHLHAFLLDEYIGLPPNHPQSYAKFIRTHFTSQVDFNDSYVHSPSSDSARASTTPQEYEDLIRTYGPISVQILGIGANGHIGFNEPGSSLGSRTRIKTLTPRTRKDNARFFTSIDEVPTHAITQGLATIAEAQHIVLIATGKKKATAIANMVEGPISAWCPASSLQLHPHVTVVIDNDAGQKLQAKDFYIYEHTHKPIWQRY